jgi:hypothetical protein
MPLNLSIEGLKWKILASSAQPIRYIEALKSVLAGISLSVITPNRIGEYPGRIIYLKRKNSVRLISVAVLAAVAQFITLFSFGILGLVYYNIHFPGTWQKAILAVAIIMLIAIVFVFFRFEHWSRYIEHIRWLKKLRTYGSIVRRFTLSEQFKVLGLSALRFVVFTTQYLLLLRWMNIPLSLTAGFCTASLFFWAIAVIPSIALAELGIRGKVGLFLFHSFSSNSLGIVTATLGLWGMNLVVPAIAGTFLLMRIRLLK